MNSTEATSLSRFIGLIFFLLCGFSSIGQSQNLRFKEIIRMGTNTHQTTISYTVPAGHVFKMTSYTVDSQQGYDAKLKWNGLSISERVSGENIGYGTKALSCEIWFSGGDVIEIETYPSSSYSQRSHFSGILYELY